MHTAQGSRDNAGGTLTRLLPGQQMDPVFIPGGIEEIIIIIGIQPLGRFGQRPEFSQATGMALVRCILGKFLGVVCHCFPPIEEI